MIFDAHADILTDMFQEHQKGHVDSFKHRHLEAYQKAGITHSIFVNWTNPKTSNPEEFNEIFTVSLREIHNNSDIFHVCTTYDDLFRAREQQKLGIILGIEGLAQLQSVANLTTLYEKGIRHATLTWNEVNHFAGGLDSETEGLTLIGQELVQHMEELGMIIDLAHANPVTFNDVFNHTTKPLIISHGNVKSLCSHRRNYTDNQLLQLRDRGGVIGICAIGPFISDDPNKQTVEEMAKHIDYAVNLIGIDHVGVGFDICYYLGDINLTNRVKGFQTIADARNLFEVLRQMGYNEVDIEKIAFGNFARIVQQILK